MVVCPVLSLHGLQKTSSGQYLKSLANASESEQSYYEQAEADWPASESEQPKSDWPESAWPQSEWPESEQSQSDSVEAEWPAFEYERPESEWTEEWPVDSMVVLPELTLYGLTDQAVPAQHLKSLARASDSDWPEPELTEEWPVDSKVVRPVPSFRGLVGLVRLLGLEVLADQVEGDSYEGIERWPYQ